MFLAYERDALDARVAGEAQVKAMDAEDYKFVQEGCRRWAKLLREHADNPCEFTAEDLRKAAKWLDGLVDKGLIRLDETYGNLLVEHLNAARANNEALRERIYQAIEVMRELWPVETKAWEDMFRHAEGGGGKNVGRSRA